MRPENDIPYAGDVRRYIDNNGLIGLEDFLRKKLEEWKDIGINISVTGGVGAGKSSFINALRG
jgi:tRNA U34 5-carboxymethylaminomethyl modifying GTPase MnmE/TrmE